jgi:OOP family OmpA-OmpF porin
MKKLLILFCILFIFKNMQAQNTCATAVNFAIAPAGPLEIQTQSVKWYKFTSKSTKVKYKLRFISSTGSDKPNKIILWSGACGSLTQLGADTLSSTTDSLLEIANYTLTNNTTYYIEVRKSNSTNTIEYLTGTNFRAVDPACNECNLPPSTTCELICNGSFEYNLNIPNMTTGPVGSLDVCGWENLTNASPDYFTTSSPAPPSVLLNQSVNIPNSFVGPQTARTGNAMTGFIAGASAAGNWHEYIYQTLQAPLTQGVTYTLSFYVKPSTNTTNAGHFANSIGAWFASFNDLYLNPITSTQGELLTATPQVTYSGFVNNTTGWTQVSGTFIATGLEEYIVIGNFGSTYNVSSSYQSYYFLDDVSLSTAPLCNAINYDLILPAGNIFASSLSGGFTPVTINNWNMYITGNFYVDHDLTLSDCNIVLNTNSQIILTNNAKLTLTNKTHLYGCCTMWDGIYVRQGSSLYSENDVIVEDANHAFVSQTIGTTYGGYIHVDKTLFNRCYTGIEIQPNTATYSPLYLTNSVFTSRNIPFDAINTNNLTVAQYNTNLLTYSSINQKSHPYTSAYGVLATDVNFLKVGEYNSAPQGPNKFDNLYVGVNWIRTNGIIHNNHFQELLKPNTFCAFCDAPPSLKGIGINAVGNATNNSILAGVPATAHTNYFRNVNTSIFIDNYSAALVTRANISNTSTGPFGINQTGYGKRGIYVKPATTNQLVNIVDNTVRNCETAINLVRSASNFSTYDIKIDTNTVDAVLPGYCTYGIYVQDFMNNTSAPPTSEINSNTIVNARYGITCTNTKSTSVKYNSVTTLNGTGVRYGMKFGGCKEMKIENNHTKYSDGLAALSGGNLTAYGIYLSSSTNMLVKCNEIDDAGRGMIFEQTCTSPLTLSSSPTVGITQNSIHKAQDGFVLKTNGVIGTQGNGTYPSNNKWDATTNYFRSQTYTEGTVGANTNSKLFNNITQAPLPTDNETSSPGNEYILNSGLNTSNGTTSACGYVPAFAPGDGGTSFSSSGISSNNTLSNDLMAIVNDNSVLPAYDQESHYMRKTYVFEALKKDPALKTNNSVLTNFYTTNNNSNIGKFSKVDERMSAGNYNQANTLNNSINPNFLLEQNQKSVNALILKKMLNNQYIYNTNDSILLMDIAVQCPLQGGNVVYQARNLLAAIYNDLIDFEENCEDVDRSYMQNTESQEIATNQKSDYRLYPNPNDGRMNFVYDLFESEKGELVIYDISGRTIQSFKLQIGTNNQLFIDETKLGSGVYFYKVLINEKIKTSDKLIIIK